MSLYPFDGTSPAVAASAFVAPGARLIGDVTIGPDSSVWYNAVLHGDVARISVGARSNIQDGSVMHVSGTVSGGTAGARWHTEIGDDVLIGHLAIRHGCVIESGGFVGLGAVGRRWRPPGDGRGGFRSTLKQVVMLNLFQHPS